MRPVSTRPTVPFKWRGWWDFGTGALGDIGCHAMDPVFRALKLGAPLSVQAASTRVNEETYPLGSMVTYQFPARSAAPQANNCHVKGLSGAAAGGVAMPPCKLVWYDGGLRPPRPEGLPDGKPMGDNGRLLVGDKGFILGNDVYPESRAKAGRRNSQDDSRALTDHYQEWITACKGGQPAGANFDWAGPLAESVLLGNVALRTAAPGRPDALQAALGFRRPQVHEPGGGQPIPPPRLPCRLESIAAGRTFRTQTAHHPAARRLRPGSALRPRGSWRRRSR